MNKDQVLRKLQAVINQITCMNLNEFEKLVSGNTFEMNLNQMGWGDESKVEIKIYMRKTKVSE